MATFDERARTWDTDERRERAEAVAKAIRSAVPLTPETRTIDLGAGTGLLGLALVDEVGELVLAEPSSGMLEVAREKISRLGRPGVSAVSFDLMADAPPGAAVRPRDLAARRSTTSPTRAPALAAILGLLRPGGRLALSDLDAEDGTFHDADAEGVQHHGFDRERLEATAREVGFVDVATRTATTWVNERGAFPLFLLTARRPEADAR